LPELVVVERRAEEERSALTGLARWATLALSPRVAVDHERRALLVDVTGTALVHESEVELLDGALRAVLGFGFRALGAIAPTPRGALGVACSSRTPLVVPDGALRSALEGASPAVLGLDAPVLESLDGLGVRTIGALLALPRRALPVRLGEATLERIDRALGDRPDPIEPVRFEEPIRERLVLDGATDRFEDLAAVMTELAERLEARLSAEAIAARTLSIELARDGGKPVSWRIRLGASATRARSFARLLHHKLERLDLSIPIAAIEVRLDETGKARRAQGDLFEAWDAGEEEEAALLVARLEDRLGPRKVVRPTLVADHRPERAWREEPASASSPTSEARDRLAAGARPTTLHARPLAIDVRVDAARPVFATARVAEAIGPERIEAGFWDGADARRDYWIARLEDGRALWLFHDLDSGQWFVHGSFD
jgi:protein ImuB